MKTSVLLSLLVVLLLALIMTELSGNIFTQAFLGGQCKRKRWSKCETKLKFSIVKRTDKPVEEKKKEILIENWKEIVKRRTGSTTRAAMMKVLKDMEADIVADVELQDNE